MAKKRLPMDKIERWTNDFLKSDFPNGFVKAQLHFFCEALMHTHDFYEICFVIHGSGKYFYGDQCIEAKVGDVFITPPDIYHGYLKDTDFYIYNLCISKDFFEYFKREIDSIPPVSELIEGVPYMHQLNRNGFVFHLYSNDLVSIKNDLDLICECQNMNMAYQENIKNNITLKILSHLSYLYSVQYKKWATSNENNSFAAVMESVHYMKANFENKVTIEDLANAAHMSRSSYIRHFKQVFSTTPIDYLRSIRLNRARTLLTEGKASKSVVAQECGFYDTAHLLKYL